MPAIESRDILRSLQALCTCGELKISLEFDAEVLGGSEERLDVLLLQFVQIDLHHL